MLLQVQWEAEVDVESRGVAVTETPVPSQATTMKAIVRDEYGPAEVLQVRDIACPTPTDDELLVRVRAASVGAWDWHDLRGDPYFMRVAGMGARKPKRPVLGLDMAGEVIKVGKNVTRFQPGDSVFHRGGRSPHRRRDGASRPSRQGSGTTR